MANTKHGSSKSTSCWSRLILNITCFSRMQGVFKSLGVGLVAPVVSELAKKGTSTEQCQAAVTHLIEVGASSSSPAWRHMLPMTRYGRRWRVCWCLDLPATGSPAEFTCTNWGRWSRRHFSQHPSYCSASKNRYSNTTALCMTCHRLGGLQTSRSVNIMPPKVKYHPKRAWLCENGPRLGTVAKPWHLAPSAAQ